MVGKWVEALNSKVEMTLQEFDKFQSKVEI